MSRTISTDLILRGRETISDLILRSGVFAASRRVGHNTILRDARKERAPQDDAD